MTLILDFVMKFSAMGKKHVILSLAMCILLSSLHEVSCQVDETKVINPLDEPKLQVKKLEDSCDVDSSIQSEAVRGQCSSSADGIQRSTEVASMGSLQQYESKKRNGSSVTMESQGSGPTGVWPCFQGKNGVKKEEEFPPECDLGYIHYEESTYEESSSNTYSLEASLRNFVEKQKAKTYRKSPSLEKLKIHLRSYRHMKWMELVLHPDFEKILTMARLYEDRTSASISYIMRLSMYKNEMLKGIKAMKRVDILHQRTMLLHEIANEKQRRVDIDFELAKALARKGDKLLVKIFAMKKAMVKLEVKKEEVEKSFQKIVANLSILTDEAAQAFEEHYVAVLKWQEEVKPSQEYSYDDIESAESDWTSFLNTL